MLLKDYFREIKGVNPLDWTFLLFEYYHNPEVRTIKLLIKRNEMTRPIISPFHCIRVLVSGGIERAIWMIRNGTEDMNPLCLEPRASISGYTSNM